MVIEDDHAVADQAMTLIAVSIETPATWKASWRQNLRWRGLSREGAAPQPRRQVLDNKSIVCFTGGKTSGKNRAGWLAEAVANGWETIDSASPSTDVMVADDVFGTSGKLKAARKNGTVVVSYDEWHMVMSDGVLPPGSVGGPRHNAYFDARGRGAITDELIDFHCDQTGQGGRTDVS